jgi:cytochrome c-type biogenesis protein CcmF
VPLLLLMGIGPLIACRRASIRSLGRMFAWPAGVSLLAGVALIALGAGSSPTGLVAYTFCAFVLASITLEFTRGTRARRATQGGSLLGAFSELVGRNRRRYGGYVVHAAIVLLAIGIVGSSAYDTVAEQRLQRGETMRVGDYEMRYLGSTTREGANAREVRSVFDVRKDGQPLGRLEPGKNEYRAEQQTSSEVAIRSDWLTGEDLFLDAQRIYPNGGDVQLRVFVKPLVNLLWVAGFVFLLGAVVAMWPDAREQRRLALRYAPAHA